MKTFNDYLNESRNGLTEQVKPFKSPLDKSIIDLFQKYINGGSGEQKTSNHSAFILGASINVANSYDKSNPTKDKKILDKLKSLELTGEPYELGYKTIFLNIHLSNEVSGKMEYTAYTNLNKKDSPVIVLSAKTNEVLSVF